MLIIALVLAVVGLAALVFAVVATSQAVAWICIGASVLGVVLLIVDALQERRRRGPGKSGDESKSEAGTDADDDGPDEDLYEDYPEDAAEAGGAGVSSGDDEESSQSTAGGGGARAAAGGSDEFDHSTAAQDENAR